MMPYLTFKLATICLTHIILPLQLYFTEVWIFFYLDPVHDQANTDLDANNKIAKGSPTWPCPPTLFWVELLALLLVISENCLYIVLVPPLGSYELYIYYLTSELLLIYLNLAMLVFPWFPLCSHHGPQTQGCHLQTTTLTMFPKAVLHVPWFGNLVYKSGVILTLSFISACKSSFFRVKYQNTPISFSSIYLASLLLISLQLFHDLRTQCIKGLWRVTVS